MDGWRIQKKAWKKEIHEEIQLTTEKLVFLPGRQIQNKVSILKETG